MVEEWKDIPECPGYQASSFGRVRSVTRTVKGRAGFKSIRRGMILSPNKHSDRHPYPCYNLRLPGQPRRMYPAHRLVLWAFVGPQPKGMHVRHLDGDCANNRVENLKYGTQKENQADRKQHGTASIGEQHPLAKLTELQILEIRSRLAKGEKQKALAIEYGVGQSAISLIKNRIR